ncbi:MAG: putative molybdenum carrier protein [Elusimicrobia bacterium]|nr:putative molybdenum carrier protein [Elusimicrobiota bacterium]
MLKKIISGGQTGVDRAALDFALEAEIDCGGWCPKGRIAEDGPIEQKYPLEETPSEEYAQRTEWNVRDSDATLILTIGEPKGGTALTVYLAGRGRKPCLVVDLRSAPEAHTVRDWLKERRVSVLNVAGPRESNFPDIGLLAKAFLDRVFERGSAP